MFEALTNCSDLLEAFGGHDMAAGFSILPENIEEFTCRMGEEYEKTKDDAITSVLDIDAEIVKPRIITVENVLEGDLAARDACIGMLCPIVRKVGLFV